MSAPIEAEVVGPSRALERRQPTPDEMLIMLFEKGITADSAAAVKELVLLKKQMMEWDAEKEFLVAFLKLQQEIPNVEATSAVPNKDGSIRYTYAKFEEIDEQAAPICMRHGFTYTFSEGESSAGKITKICTLQHVGTHKRSNSYSVRIGHGPPSSSESQADGAAHSYAKRGALCDALNIVVKGQDNDARNEGGAITAEQAASLRARVHATGSIEASFLKFAGSARYEDIPAAKYSVLDENLKRKERTT